MILHTKLLIKKIQIYDFTYKVENEKNIIQTSIIKFISNSIYFVYDD